VNFLNVYLVYLENVKMLVLEMRGSGVVGGDGCPEALQRKLLLPVTL